MATYSNAIYIIIGLPDEIIVGGDQDMEFKKSSRSASVMPFVPMEDQKLRREGRGGEEKRGERRKEEERREEYRR